MQGSCGLKFYQGYSGISTIPLRLLPLLSPGCCRCHQGNQHARPTVNSRPVPQPPTALSAPAAARRVPRPGPGPVSGGLWAGAAGSMARAAASSALEDLDLSAEEVQRLTSAFRDPEFRRLFSDYAEELTDPDNRRRYEAEITALERERGVDVRFVHPEPGHVLRTSLDGARRGFVNVCSNALVDAPRGRPDGHWSLPYSLAPGREYLGRRGGRYTVYDVGEEEEREQQWEERGPGERAVWTAAVGEEPPPGAGSLPGTSAGSPGRGPGAGAGGARGDPRGEAMGGPGAARREPVCPPSRCRQDEESLTLLVQVPRIQPQSLQGDLSPVGYQLRFSTQDLGSYAFSLRFAPENQLSCRAPAVSVSPHNAVIELAKAPGCRGPWREWYYGPHGGSLEERLFVNEENVNEVLEEVLSSPSTWTEPLTPPLIEVLQVTDSKIQIHAKLQECSNSEQLHENEETVNEGSHLTEKESTEHSTSFPSESADSSGAVQVLETDSCGSAAHLQQESLDISKMSLGKSEQSESKMEPEFIKEKRAVYSNEEKDNLKEPVTTEEELLDDHLSSLLNKTTVHSGSGFDNIKETNMQDGSVQIIKDHVTHCAFSFQNSLLYDLD
nr:PREDICTED: protein kintoun [Equus przewalskii]